jgi:cytochrome c553
MVKRTCLFVLLLASPLALAVIGQRAAADPTPEGVEFFEKKIRPLLVENCHECHSTAHKMRGKLLLDSRAGLLKGGETGPVVVPGDIEKSLILKAVRYDDPDLKMPPRGKLSDQQIADLTAWVKMGAPWPDDGGKVVVAKTFNLKERAKHWSLQPIRKPPLPKVANPDWCRSPVDYFVLARLEAAGLKPAAPADKRTLIRRVTFDLTGLPPTPAEVEAFLTDESADAFARVVDRLLASPQYGERWARHWLDLVRFAETLGHEFDFDLPEAYLYRDYVIRALNADLPYNQFVLEHIAGDLLPGPRRHPTEHANESIVGTGFWYLGEAKHSPVDVRADQADHLDNQIDVFSKTFLAMTVACARCHDHKFDAISTRDYYALAGFLQSARQQRAFIDDPQPVRAKVKQLQALRAEIASLLGIEMSRSPGAAPGAAPGADAPGSGSGSGSNSTGKIFADFRKDTYKNWFISGEAFGDAPSGPGAMLLQADPKRPVKTLVSPGIAHSGLVSGKLQGVLRSPTFVIDKNKIHYRVLGNKGEIHLIIDGYQLLRDPIYGGLGIRIDNAEQLQWRSMDVSMWQGHRAYIEIVDDGPGYIGVEQIVFSDDGPPAAKDPGGQPGPPAPAAARLAELLKEYQKVEASLTVPRRAMAMQEGTPVDERVFVRGNHKILGELVPRRFLEVFEPAALAPPSAPGLTSPEPARLLLARKLVDPSNPLVARVMVNRLWKHHFGEGIVRTPDDFGVLGQVPTHPELLDWLATRFVADGWSLKKMHRLLVLSSTYQMASRADTEADKHDPENKLLHKMPIRRLEAEAIRDAMLAVSGRLNPKMYGPGVMPYLTPFMVGRGRPAVSGPLDGDGRRSIYLNVRRNFLNPMFVAFDYPTPFSTIGKRSVSNVPAQALTLMNNPFVLEQARVWGKRVADLKGLTALERTQLMFETAFARPPSAKELADVLAFVEEQGRQYGSASDARVWADLGHVLFNVKEFIFVP